MATVSAPRPRVNLSACHGKIRHPLQRLRVYIRAYIAAECVALLLIFIAAWFWLGLLADYGLFALTRGLISNLISKSTPPFDWMEHVPAIFPVLLFLLIGLSLGIVAYHIFRRFIREFRDKALALLLERRFPKLLGDRLITAIELADINAHTKVGYSRAMIEQTIQEAADRVDQIPISKVFNWTRLTLMYLLFGFMSFGMTALFAIGFMILTAPTDKHNKIDSGWRAFTNARSTWLARNFGLRRTYYDRESYLEVQGYPRYRLTGDSLRDLKKKDHLPNAVADKLLVLVDRHEITSETLTRLRDEDKVPAEVVGKLAPLVGHEMPTEEFLTAVEEKLSGDELKNHRQQILSRARKVDGVEQPNDGFLDAVKAQLTAAEYERYSESIRDRAKRVDLRVGRDRGTAEVRVRAYRWVIASEDPLRGRYGWRPMKWSDVTPELLGTKDSIPDLPSSWLVHDEFFGVLAGPTDGLMLTAVPYASILGSQQAAAEEWTVDRVENRLGDEDLDVARLEKLRDVLKRAHKEERILGNGISIRNKGYYIQEKLEDGSQRERDLMWSDVMDRSEQLGMEVPSLPKQWGQDLTFDEVIDRVAKADIDRLLDIKKTVLDRLEVMAEQTGFGRKVRALKVPRKDDEVVTIFYNTKEANKSNKATMNKLAGNEFTVTLTELKDDLTYTIRGEDYFTRPGHIEIIPEPFLQDFTYERYIPAYICYRLSNGKVEELKGRHQLFEETGLAKGAGEESTIDLPSGSRITIKGKADRPLKQPPTIISYAGEHYSLPATASLNPNDNSMFTVEVGQLLIRDFIQDGKIQLQKEYTFDLEIVDFDNVRNTYHLKIKLKEDDRPAVNVKVPDFIREVKKETEDRGFEGSKIVTVGAWIPFIGDIKDDHGLAGVDFVFQVAPVESRVDPVYLNGTALASIGQYFTPAGAGLRAVLPMIMLKSAQKSGPTKALVDYRAGLPQFTMSRRPGLTVNSAELDKLLPMKFEEVYRKKMGLPAAATVPNLALNKDVYVIEPDAPNVLTPRTGLDLRILQERMTDTEGKPLLHKASVSEVQIRYKLQVEVEARDADVETGPHRAVNKESFTFMIVSEAELMGLVARDEEELSSVDLVKTLEELQDADGKAKDGWRDIYQGPKDVGEFPKISYRMNKADEALDHSKSYISKVGEDMERILAEVQANRVNEKLVQEVEDVVTLLHKILEKDYEEVKKAMAAWHSVLDDKSETNLTARTAESLKAAENARTRITELITDVRGVRDRLGNMISVAKLVEQLRLIDEKNEEIRSRMEKLYEEIVRALLKGDDKPK